MVDLIHVMPFHFFPGADVSRMNRVFCLKTSSSEDPKRKHKYACASKLQLKEPVDSVGENEMFSWRTNVKSKSRNSLAYG